MGMTFDQGKDKVAKLVDYFSTNEAAFHAPTFKEAQACGLLIDPLFIALGWDVRNESHAAPQYVEVVPARDT